MKQRHIAIFTLLGAGNVYPLLGLCSELVGRGYRVTYATTEQFSGKIGETGAESVLLSLIDNPKVKSELEAAKNKPLHDPSWWEMTATVVYPHILNIARVSYLQVKNYYERDVPDLILYDRLAFAGRIVASDLGIPAIQIYPHFALHEKFLYRDNGVCRNPEPMLGFAKILDSFLLAHGITTTDNLWHREKLNIYFLPKEFQYEADSLLDVRSRFVGASLRRPFRSAWVNNSGGRPIVLVSCISGGSDIAYFKTCICALSSLGCHVILSIGTNTAPASLGALPSGFEINQHASHLEILPHASVLICQGGMGSSLEALYHGVPVVAVPPIPLSDEVAYRVAELGLGIRLPRWELTSEMIKDSVRESLGNTALIGRVREIQQVFQRYNGTQTAANEIEHFLEAVS